MTHLTDILSLNLLIFACMVTLFGGVVKGAVGFAMPLIMISGMGTLIDPQIVVAGIILPIVVSNALQIFRSGLGDAWTAAKDYRVYIGIVCVTIVISAQFLKSIPANTMFVVLGVPVVVLCAIQLAGVRLVIAPQWRAPFSWLAGLIAGALGGLAGTWGPPTVLYLVAVDTPKARQITVQGVIYGLGSVMLLLGHLQSGVLNWKTVPLSALLVVPALLGMAIGFRIQDRIDQSAFRKATLAVLMIAGANLVRRGLM